MKNVFFIDLDNTVMFTKHHKEALMDPLYRLLENEDLGIDDSGFEKMKTELTRTPFQKVAEKYQIKKVAVDKALSFLQGATPEGPLTVHYEYHYIKDLEGQKFLVTAGFTKMQMAKVEKLGISEDFEEVIVIDNTKTEGTKKEAFQKLIDRYKFSKNQVLVIGDDANSEIKYGLELGLDTFLFDPDNIFSNHPTTYRSKSLNILKDIV